MWVWPSRNRGGGMCYLNAINMERARKMERAINELNSGMREYEVIKGHHVENEEIEKETMRYLKVMNNKQR